MNQAVKNLCGYLGQVFEEPIAKFEKIFNKQLSMPELESDLYNVILTNVFMALLLSHYFGLKVTNKTFTTGLITATTDIKTKKPSLSNFLVLKINKLRQNPELNRMVKSISFQYGKKK